GSHHEEPRGEQPQNEKTSENRSTEPSPEEAKKEHYEQARSETHAFIIVDGGTVKASVSNHQGRNGEYDRITFFRVCEEGEAASKKPTRDFRPQDIEALIAVAEKALAHVSTLTQTKDEEQENEILITR